MRKMSEQALLIDEAKEMYTKLFNIYNKEKGQQNIPNICGLLFKTVHPQSTISQQKNSPNEWKVNGIIPNVRGTEDANISASILAVYQDSDIRELIENLTMAYYTTNGGKYCQSARELINRILER